MKAQSEISKDNRKGEEVIKVELKYYDFSDLINEYIENQWYKNMRINKEENCER